MATATMPAGAGIQRPGGMINGHVAQAFDLAVYSSRVMAFDFFSPCVFFFGKVHGDKGRLEISL